MNLDRRTRMAPEVMTRRVGGETVFLNLTSGLYFGLNEVGSRAWQLMEHNLTLAEVSVALAAEYDVGLPEVQADVLALAAELEGRRLISLH